MIELILGLIAVISITYFVMVVAHYLVVWLIKTMKWDKTDWFHDMVEKENN